ncbi:type II toxin-antitoxin system VapC family toxin [Candidatus Gottesmanbacteria bacterium]|nr:type II toxin-antitoxin system VapC family toxin [Candidatus Gottesmanbacteria bacterium]
MKTYVIDASVALKWISSEKEEELISAQKLYQNLKDGNLSIYTPTFLLVETANILLKKKKLTKKEVGEYINVILNCGINFIDFNYLKINDLLDITSEYDVTTYDGLYLLLAKEMNCQLVSTDRELIEIAGIVLDLKETNSDTRKSAS